MLLNPVLNFTKNKLELVLTDCSHSGVTHLTAEYAGWLSSEEDDVMGK